MKKPSILLIDDDKYLLSIYADLLEKENFNVISATSGEEAVEITKSRSLGFAIAIVDFHIPNGMNGSKTIAELNKIDERILFVGMSGDDSDAPYTNSLQAGAIVFLQKGMPVDRFLKQIKTLVQKYEDTNGIIQVESIPYDANLIAKIGLIGVSKGLQIVAAETLKYATNNLNVLIRGENGTGKERVAMAIHENSQNSHGPFVAVNCAAIPENLIESELFGHDKGAFTGAVQSKLGFFRQANLGTIFLDEIGDMPLHLQVKLLRVLQEKEITPVGSSKTMPVTVRVVAATNRNLEKMVNDGTFREDLFHRLNVLTIKIPPLRERKNDIEPLVAHFVEEVNRKNNFSVSFQKDTLYYLRLHNWPGNVRELESVVIRLAVNKNSGILTAEDVNAALGTSNKYALSEVKTWEQLKTMQEEKEKDFLIDTLKNYSSVSEAAEKLMISRSSLQDKMKNFKIKVRQTI